MSQFVSTRTWRERAVEMINNQLDRPLRLIFERLIEDLESDRQPQAPAVDMSWASKYLVSAHYIDSEGNPVSEDKSPEIEVDTAKFLAEDRNAEVTPLSQAIVEIANAVSANPAPTTEEIPEPSKTFVAWKMPNRLPHEPFETWLERALVHVPRLPSDYHLTPAQFCDLVGAACACKQPQQAAKDNGLLLERVKKAWPSAQMFAAGLDGFEVGSISVFRRKLRSRLVDAQLEFERAA